MTEHLAVGRCRGPAALSNHLAFPAPARIQTCLISRDFLVLICLRIFERKTKTKDKFKDWAKFVKSSCLYLGREVLTK